MNGNISLFEKVLQKLSFRQPVDNESKQFVFAYKRKALEITLKHFGELTFFYSIILRIYFFAKRTGRSLTILQCKVVLAAISFILLIILYSGIYFSLNMLSRQPVVDTIQPNNNILYPQSVEKGIIIHPDNKIKFQDNNKRKTVSPDNTGVRVGIERYTGNAVDQDILNFATNTIANDLIKKHGRNTIIKLYEGKKKKNINLLLTGSIERLGSTYIINTKLVNIENSEVIFIASDNVKDIDKIQNACLNITKKTAEKLK